MSYSPPWPSHPFAGARSASARKLLETLLGEVAEH